MKVMGGRARTRESARLRATSVLPLPKGPMKTSTRRLTWPATHPHGMERTEWAVSGGGGIWAPTDTGGVGAPAPRGPIHEVQLPPPPPVEPRADTVGAHLPRQIDLDGGVDRDHLRVLGDDERIVHVVRGMELDHRIVVGEIVPPLGAPHAPRHRR